MDILDGFVALLLSQEINGFAQDQPTGQSRCVNLFSNNRITVLTSVQNGADNVPGESEKTWGVCQALLVEPTC